MSTKTSTFSLPGAIRTVIVIALVASICTYIKSPYLWILLPSIGLSFASVELVRCWKRLSYRVTSERYKELNGDWINAGPLWLSFLFFGFILLFNCLFQQGFSMQLLEGPNGQFVTGLMRALGLFIFIMAVLLNRVR